MNPDNEMNIFAANSLTAASVNQSMALINPK
jgi:hypothetical protein